MLAAIAEGGLVRVACAAIGRSHATIYDWSERTATNREAYRAAREAQAHALGERAMSQSTGGDAVAQVIERAIQEHAATLSPEDRRSVVNSLQHAAIQRDRLIVDTLRWYTSKLAPGLYGERLAIDATVEARHAVVVLPPRGEALAQVPEAEAVPALAGALARLRASTERGDA